MPVVNHTLFTAPDGLFISAKTYLCVSIDLKTLAYRESISVYANTAKESDIFICDEFYIFAHEAKFFSRTADWRGISCWWPQLLLGS